MAARTGEEADQYMEKTLKIEGMMCDHCVMHVQKALAAIPGVQEANVSLENKSATVTIDPIVADETLRYAIEEAICSERDPVIPAIDRKTANVRHVFCTGGHSTVIHSILPVSSDP